MVEQLDLLAAVRPYTEPQKVSGRQHLLALEALYAASERGMTGEEVAVYCRFRATHIATTRLGEMADDRERFPVPLVARSEKKDRPTASGRMAYRWFLTDCGREFVEQGRAVA